MLHLFKLVPEDGAEVKILERVAFEFQKVAIALGFQHGVYEAVLLAVYNDHEHACMKIFEKWLNGEGRKPVTWATLIQALEDAGFRELARQLKNAVRRDGIHVL